MGQYFKLVCLDKREYVNPHKLGAGLKLWEQLANHPGTGAALIVLCAAMPEPRGGGDFDMNENWHGPERVFPEDNVKPGTMPETYPELAKSVIGRWAGCRVALVGDYAEDGDLPPEYEASKIYGLCRDDVDIPGVQPYTDISDLVATVIAHELNMRRVGTGWMHWIDDNKKWCGRCFVTVNSDNQTCPTCGGELE